MVSATQPAPSLLEFETDRHYGPLVVLIPGLGGGHVPQWQGALDAARDAGADIAYTVAVSRSLLARERSLAHVQAYGEAIGRELNSVGAAHVILVAHSVGAFVAFAAASVSPHVDATLVVNGGLSTVARFLDSPVSTYLQRPRTCTQALRLFCLLGLPAPQFLTDAVARHPAIARPLLRGLVSERVLSSPSDLHSLLQAAGNAEVLVALWLNRHHWRRFLGRRAEINGSVVFLAGADDPIAPIGDAQEMAALIEGASVVPIAGGHSGPLEDPEAIRKTLSTLVTATSD